MDRTEILRCLVETVIEVQQLSGAEVLEITAETSPILDLDEFDSLRGVETTELLAAKLKCAFKGGTGNENVFVSQDGRRALKIEEAVDRILQLQR